MKNRIQHLIFVFILISSIPQGYSQSYKSVNEAKGLAIGAIAPLFSAIDSDSSIFKLADALKKGTVVIIFYRGNWCPVCNKHLSQIQDSLSLITAKGATVIAISPEKPKYLAIMKDKTGVGYRLLYDENYKIAKAFDVNFKPSATTLFTYNVFLGAKIKETHSDDSQRLPIPATFIIDINGKIVWRQFDANYKHRSMVKDILNNLP